tara:strand:- start:2858 stop:3109 length:252 start_codon:yes stop_codon:yes gene_type:complete
MESDLMKTAFGSLSVEAGVDNNHNPTQADRIVGAKKSDLNRSSIMLNLSCGKGGCVNKALNKERRNSQKKSMKLAKKRIRRGG